MLCDHHIPTCGFSYYCLEQGKLKRVILHYLTTTVAIFASPQLNQTPRKLRTDVHPRACTQNVHSNIIRNSPKVETIPKSMNR